jgi:hypothetical protein
VLGQTQVRHYQTVEFNADLTATITSICTYATGTVLNAKFTTRFQVTGGNITFLDAGTNTSYADVDGSARDSCAVNVSAGTAAYIVAGDVLTLVDAGFSTTLDRQ